ncbi:hypothetical protein RI367_005606 [Sorochytrium milnesiophthora]
MPRLALVWLLACVTTHAVLAQQSASSLFRAIDGSSNNVQQQTWGAANQPYIRVLPERTTPYPSPRPSPRDLSVKLFGLTEAVYSNNTVNALAVFVGQFLAHDVLVSSTNNTDQMPISISTCDVDYDKLCQGNQTIPFARQSYVLLGNSTTRTYINGLSAWVDASNVYGATAAVTNQLRSFSNGMLTLTPNGMLPNTTNSANIMADPNGFPWTKLLLAGDIRANENAALQTLHTLFAREHNRRAAYLQSLYPSWSDEILFQNARKWVIGIWQRLVFEEYAPTLLGTPLAPYAGYNSSINPGIDVFFMAASFRYGHSAVPNIIREVDANGRTSPAGHFALRDTMFNPSYVLRYGIDGILRGLITQPEGKVDTLVTRELRVPFKNHAPFDLPAFNIQRGRDLHLPTYNDARRFFGLPPANTTADISSDLTVQMWLDNLYGGNIEAIDAFVGGLGEDRLPGARVGPMFAASLREQLTRLRDGDRYYYRNPGSGYSPADQAEIDAFSFQKLVLSNTAITQYPTAVFAVSDPLVAFTNTSSQCPSSSSSTTPSLQITTGFSVSWAVSTAASTITFDYSIGFDSGWFAFGLGTGMMGVDIWAVSIGTDGTLSVHDYWSDNYLAVLDTSLGGTDNLVYVQDLGAINGYKKVVRFTRALVTGDSKDLPIAAGSTNVIWAWSTTTSTIGYHGANRGSGAVDFFASVGSSTTTIAANSGWPMSLKILHGFIMLISFGFIMPLVIYIARYHHTNAHWIDWHHKIASLAASEVIFAAVTAYVGGGQVISHAVIGIIMAVATLVQTCAGHIIQSDYRFFHPYVNASRSLHIVFGPLMLLVGNANCYLGIQRLVLYDASFQMLTWWYSSWILLVLLAFIRAEYYKLVPRPPQYQTLRKGKSGLLSAALGSEPGKLSQNLPEFDWNDINARVSRGSLWAVVEGVIYDLAKFAHMHPGGKEVLYAAVGTDATAIFEGTSGYQRHRGPSELTYDPKQFKATLRRLAHAHSRLAKMKMRALAVGCVSGAIPEVSLPFIPKDLQRELSNGIMQLGLCTWKATTLVLSSKTLLVPSDAGKPVYRFRFDFESPTDELLCLPGDYVTLQTVTSKGQLLQRSYTPIRCVSKGSLELVIKIYAEGPMTSWLGSLNEGDLIAARGPTRGTSMLSQVSDNGTYTDVGMIVCGSGLTPALLLLDYYSTFGYRDNNGKLRHRIHLLFINGNEREIFCRSELDDLASRSNGAIKVNYLVKHGSTNWTGHTGTLSPEIIANSMPKPIRPASSTNDHLNEPGLSEGALTSSLLNKLMRTVSKQISSSDGSMASTPRSGSMALRDGPDIGVGNSPRASIQGGGPRMKLLSFSTKSSRGSQLMQACPEPGVQMIVCGSETFNRSTHQMLVNMGYAESSIVVV